MKFNPNSSERYASALRSYINYSIFRYGLKKKHYRMLKKIYIFEAAFYNILSSINIKEYTDTILGSSFLNLMVKGKTFKTNIKGNGNFMVNIKLYTLIILEIIFNLSNNNSKIDFTFKNSIIITVKGIIITDILKKSILKSNGYYFYSNNNLKIILNYKKTENKSLKTENEIYYIIDKFSPVNVWNNQN